MIRRKCFISYQHRDAEEVRAFVDRYRDVLIPKGIGDGVTNEDNFVNSDVTEYVLRRIREKYLADSTVTIVMVGRCTWERKYVDWEIASTLRNDANNGRSGLMGITLPSIANYADRKAPARLQNNAHLNGRNDRNGGYGRWWKYPTSDDNLRQHIEDAYAARSDAARTRLIQPRGELKKKNSPCPH
jgi:hypothetical protein